MVADQSQDTIFKAKCQCFINSAKRIPRDSKRKLQTSLKHSVLRHFSERHATNTCNTGGNGLCLHQDGEHQKGGNGRAYSRGRNSGQV